MIDEETNRRILRLEFAIAELLILLDDSRYTRHCDAIFDELDTNPVTRPEMDATRRGINRW